MKYVLFSIVICTGCATKETQGTGQVLVSAKSICEVVNNRTSYANMRVAIKGTLGEGPHQRFMYDDDCPEWHLAVSHSSNDAGSTIAKRLVQRLFQRDRTIGIPVVYSGVLVARTLISGCTKPNCYSYSLQDAQILAAFPPGKMPG